MRYRLLILLLTAMMLSACASEDEVIDQLKQDAEDHINLGKKQEGILLYEKVLNRREDPEVQQRVQQLRNEVE
ncbi:hypothetical protein [Ornithinibacillus halotolerans]|uniref:Lipoprotein n=1 Tax=Ornithinibacillus halotolerans TaxID=1274357 RepID=A0A916W4B4_9BACI|nr:hypothetical protein [Ornithinibacillus halotolerans]GGA64600.1 hypothetical protein GCM10008025_05580 [Ornithinibacillus halotolerans]